MNVYGLGNAIYLLVFGHLFNVDGKRLNSPVRKMKDGFFDIKTKKMF